MRRAGKHGTPGNNWGEAGKAVTTQGGTMAWRSHLAPFGEAKLRHALLLEHQSSLCLKSVQGRLIAQVCDTWRSGGGLGGGQAEVRIGVTISGLQGFDELGATRSVVAG